MAKIESHFTTLGYKVIFINEMATELITNNIAPWEGNVQYFQEALIRLQLTKEKIYEKWARENIDPTTLTLIVCDRGVIDAKPYIQQAKFNALLINDLNTNEIEVRDSYDAVFHLVTAANGAIEGYTLENNSARTETPEEAVQLDNATLNAWTGHPHLRVIDNSTNFDLKMTRLMKEISSFLGLPQPLEIERKFLISMPDMDRLNSLADNPLCDVTKVDIIQTYLKSEDLNVEVRVRQRGLNGNYTFTQTTKRDVSNTTRIETERRLTEKEYVTLLMNADTECRQIRKTRYCVVYKSQYFEIDIFPDWETSALMEIELSDENQEVTPPDWVDVLYEVTDSPMFRNKSLAKWGRGIGDVYAREWKDANRIQE